MAFRLIILITLLTGTSYDCTAEDENCQANYEESGLAQIKAHKAQQTKENEASVRLDNGALNHADAFRD